MVPGSPAAQAGVEPGDLLLAVDGQAAHANQIPHFRSLFGRPGPVRLDLRRGAQRKTVLVQLRPLV